MVRMCVVCKKDYVSYDKSRSFHKFPKNEELKNKWKQAIGLLSVAKTTVICSDHFDKESFSDHCGLTGEVRRLLPTAVPQFDIIKSEPCEIEFVTVSNCKSDYDMTVAAEIVDNDTKNHKSVHTDVEWLLPNNVPQNNDLDQLDTTKSAPCKIVYSTVCTLNTDNSSDLLEQNESQDSSNNDMTVTPAESVENDTKNHKRELSIADVKHKKKIRFMNGFKTEYVKKEDFVSEEAWERFLRFNAYKNLRITSYTSRYYRKAKKTFDLRDLICVLKAKEMFDTAQYFEDLPQHILELVIRLKDKKKTAPFPVRLKDFARTLYNQSPTAYDFIRSNFIKCLPSVKSLGLENDKSRNSSEIIEIDESKELIQQNEESGDFKLLI